MTASLLSWNVDGLARALDDGALAAQVARFDAPAVVCLQEVRVRPADDALVARMSEALPGYACGYSLCRDGRNVTARGGRMYGVATYARRDLDPVFRTYDWDREGRFVVALVGDLAVGNVYAVNGTDRPYFDHELGRVEGDRHAFKRRFLARVQAAARDLRAEGRALVLVGDWNVSRTRLDVFPRLRTEGPHALARAQLNDDFMPDLDLVDVFRQLHPTARKYTWFARSRAGRLDAARVDYALLSSSLLPHVVTADVVEDARGRSDHAPIVLRLRGA